MNRISSSWQSDNHPANRDVLEIHHRIYKSPSLGRIVSQMNAVHILIWNVFKMHFNIIHPPTPRTSKWSLSDFPTRILYAFLNIQNVRANLPWYLRTHAKNTCWMKHKRKPVKKVAPSLVKCKDRVSDSLSILCYILNKYYESWQ
jgi:hypothetical protein